MSDCEVSAMEEMMCQPEHPIDFSKECDIGMLQAENEDLKNTILHKNKEIRAFREKLKEKETK